MSNEADRANEPAPVDRLSKIWRRLSEHKIVQWSVAYVAVAYGLQHGVILASESLEWPSAVARISILLLALGLPLVVTFAWYHGARASRNFSQAELSILATLLVTSSLMFYVFVRPSETAAPAVQLAGVSAMQNAATSAKGVISVVVLPFSNMSGDPGQEFFSDGITEEITAALAKVPDLRVVARTSAFEFKGKNIEVDKIGQQLHATHLIEGSVRKAGDRLRITAQLIKADDGTHIWAESYDRQLTDIFEVQEDIARAIAASLHMTLGLKPGENLVNNRTIDPASYQQFLHAQALIHARGLRQLTEAAALLEQVLTRNSAYAPAWAALGNAYDLTPNSHPARDNGSAEEYRRIVDEFLPKAEGAYRRALQLDPNLAQAYSGLGIIQYQRGKILQAEQLYAKALALDPNNPDILHNRSERLASVGNLREALPMRRQVLALEPFVPVFNVGTAMILWLNGRNDEAIALARALPQERQATLAEIYASMGRYREAADVLEKTASGNETAEAAVRLLRTAPANGASQQKLPRLANLSWVYLYAGAPDHVIDQYEFLIETGRLNGGFIFSIWHPSYASVRKTERFKTFVRKAGFVDYWRAKGWPDFCHPTTGDDFECN